MWALAPAGHRRVALLPEMLADAVPAPHPFPGSLEDAPHFAAPNRDANHGGRPKKPSRDSRQDGTQKRGTFRLFPDCPLKLRRLRRNPEQFEGSKAKSGLNGPHRPPT